MNSSTSNDVIGSARSRGAAVYGRRDVSTAERVALGVYSWQLVNARRPPGSEADLGVRGAGRRKPGTPISRTDATLERESRKSVPFPRSARGQGRLPPALCLRLAKERQQCLVQRHVVCT